MSEQFEDSPHEFPFEQGDRVRVRAREHGTSGSIIADVEGTVEQIFTTDSPSSPRARIRLDFGLMNTITVRPYEAEFEVLG